MTFKFSPRFKRSSRKAGKFAKNPSFTYRMNEMDETDAYTWSKSDRFVYGKRSVTFNQRLYGTDSHDQITINQRAPHADSDAYVRFKTDIYAGQGNDIIVHKHEDQTDTGENGNGASLSHVCVWGGEGRDSFVVEGDHTGNFLVMDMEVGETMTLDERYVRARRERPSTNGNGQWFYNFEYRSGGTSGGVGVWLSADTELQFSKGPNDTSVFTLVEV